MLRVDPYQVLYKVWGMIHSDLGMPKENPKEPINTPPRLPHPTMHPIKPGPQSIPGVALVRTSLSNRKREEIEMPTFNSTNLP